MYSRHAGMSHAGSPHDAASICLVNKKRSREEESRVLEYAVENGR